MRRIQRRLDDDGRAQLLDQCAAALAAIHRARADAPGLATQDQLAQYRQRLDEMGDTTATFEWAFRWLQDNGRNLPPEQVGARRFPDGQPDRRRLHTGCRARLGTGSHRRYPRGPGVVLHQGLALRRPAEMAAGGLGGIESFVAAYERAGGGPVDRSSLRWWLVLATLRWG